MGNKVDGFGARLKKLRLSMGLNQTQMAEIANVSRMALSYYENGQRTPDIAFLQAVVRATGCGYEYLMGDEPKNIDRIKRLVRTEVSNEIKSAKACIEQAIEILEKVHAGE